MREIIFLFICAFLFGRISSANQLIVETRPDITFSELSYDFGTVKQGEILEHIFKFTNVGDGTLIINSVQPACGCTGVIIDEKKEFNQDETGEIKITFNTQGRGGTNTKTVTVSTNDPKNPLLTLTFNCNIENN